MNKILMSALLVSSSIYASDSLESWFSEGSVKGNVKYYYIETKKDKLSGDTSAHSNAIGGKLNFTTGDLYGFQTGATFMTTNGFALPNSVDTSTIGRDNGVREQGSASGNIAQDSFAILGEVFLKYTYQNLSLLYGRKVIKTPLIHAKEVRMLPSAVQGAFSEYKIDDFNIELSYLTHFKQRTSDNFMNIVEHALGADTKLITGDSKGEVIVFDTTYKNENIAFKFYNYYADDFINSIYIDGGYKAKLENISYSIDAQYINQTSIGHADNYFASIGSVTGAKKIDSNAYGLKLGLKVSESKVSFAFSQVQKDSSKHDALVLPWDGTPLFTNTITSNNLFVSNYAKGLTADSLYIGGSRGLNCTYVQTYDFTGIKGIKTALAYLNIHNDRFANNQQDYNAVLAYGRGDFSLALKGIWVNNNTSAKADGTVNHQDSKLTQYRVIANYKF